MTNVVLDKKYIYLLLLLGDGIIGCFPVRISDHILKSPIKLNTGYVKVAGLFFSNTK